MAGAWTGKEGDANRKPKVNPSQAPAADSFDPNADVLVAEDVTVSEAENLAVTFGRKAVVAMMTLKNLVEGETVSKVTISSEKNITGYYEYADAVMKGQNKEIVLNYDNAVVGSDGEFPVYFVAMPNDGVELTVVAKTDQYTYSKTFGPVKFTTGKFTKFGVNMEGCGEEVVDTDFTGDWVITGTSEGTTYAMKAYVSGNNTPAIAVKFDAEKEEIAAKEVDEIKMHFEKVSEGDYAGMYTISDSKGNYFYAASPDKNQMRADNPATKTADYYWAVSAEPDGTYSIVAEKSTNRNIMRFNIGNVIFSCYASGQLPLTLYPYSWVVEETIEPIDGVTGTISFGSNDTVIDAASVTGTDDLGNTWTVTTEGTTSFTANAAYYQVGSSKKPAASITFSTTLPNDAEVTAFSAKFGGFNGTVGDVLLEVGETEVGSGSLNGTSDVTVEASETATGKVLTVSVTNIDKGVKVYNITYSYK